MWIPLVAAWVIGMATMPIVRRVKQRRQRKRALASKSAEPTEKFERNVPQPIPVDRKKV